MWGHFEISLSAEADPVRWNADLYSSILNVSHNQWQHKHPHSVRFVDTGNGRNQAHYCGDEKDEKPEEPGEGKCHGHQEGQYDQAKPSVIESE
jgi:hypothetical protein